jgi:hypothetical protein
MKHYRMGTESRLGVAPWRALYEWRPSQCSAQWAPLPP